MNAHRTLQAQKGRSWREVPSERRSNYSHSTKAQLIEELGSLSDRVADLESQGCGQAEGNILQAILRRWVTASSPPSSGAWRVLSGVRYAFVAECLDRPTTKVRTLAFWMRDHLGENIEYAIDGTPCKTVVGGKTPFYPCDIQRLFPADSYLVGVGAESYCGLPLRDASGQIIGHLAILDVDELPQNFCELPAVKIFAARAAAELDRRRAEAERMAALGQLTAGIAHELNTPIGVVKSSVCNLERCVNRIVEAIEENQTLDEVRADRGFQRSVDIAQDNNRSRVST